MRGRVETMWQENFTYVVSVPVRLPNRIILQVSLPLALLVALSVKVPFAHVTIKGTIDKVADNRKTYPALCSGRDAADFSRGGASCCFC